MAKTDEVFAPAPGSLAGRTVLITGANSGLGLESAARLAAAGADVVATARTDAKAQQAVNEIEKRTGRKVSGVALDLADLKSVKSLPSRLPKSVSKIDVLMENAGVMAIPERLATKDGFERQIGVNHLGHYALVASLLPLLEKSSAFRIVAVSSDANKIVDGKAISQALDANLEPPYGAWTNYGLSKVFNVLFVEELRRRLPSKAPRWPCTPASCRRTCRGIWCRVSTRPRPACRRGIRDDVAFAHGGHGSSYCPFLWERTARCASRRGGPRRGSVAGVAKRGGGNDRGARVVLWD